MKTAAMALGLAALMALGACAPSNLGVLVDPLPPAQPLLAPDVAGNSALSGASLSPIKYGRPRARLSGEEQADVVAALSSAIGESRIRESSTTTEAQFASLINTFEQSTSEGRKAQVRNAVVGQLLRASTDNCNVYLKSLRGSQVASRTGFDLLTGGLSTAGGIAAPERTARLLSALSAFTNGAGASIDRDIFAEQGVEVVAQQIKLTQDALRATILGNETKSYAQWDLGSALGDVANFHGECSMLRGLANVQNAVATRDADLRAARAVAARVLAAGGSGLQVNAALVGLADAALIAPPPGLNNDALSGKAPTLDNDVRDFSDKAQICLAWTEDWLVNHADKKESDLAGDADFKADCLGQADAFIKPFFAVLKTDLTGRPTLAKTDSDFSTFLTAERIKVAAANAKLAAQIADRRVRVRLAADSMAATDTDGAKTAKEITNASGSTIAAGVVTNTDPALQAAAAAANVLPPTSINAPAVAGAAQGALQGYIRNAAPLVTHYVPTPPPARTATTGAASSGA